VTIDRRTIHLHDISALEQRRRSARPDARAVAAA
jgi:hypothetical protein